MRRFLSSLIVSIIFMFVGMVSVDAVSITISGNNSVSLNKTIDVTFTVSDYNGVPGSLNIDYPSNLLQCNTNCPKTQKVEGNTSFTYQFKGIANGVATINVTSNYNGGDASKTINVGTVTSSASSTQPSTTAPSTTQTPKSNNNNLSSLNITGDDGNKVVLSPSFSSNVYTYEATVASMVRTVSIDATLEDSKANMVISNNADEELVAGENNRITITVTAEDGSKRAYTINIAREALTADATLKELTIKEVKSFKLEDDKFTYNIKIKKGVKELTIDYALSDENASVEIDGNENLKDGSKVKITVTAEDGTKKVYTLNISVEDEDTKTDTSSISVEKNPLIIMGLSIIAFGLIGGIIYVIKK